MVGTANGSGDLRVPMKGTPTQLTCRDALSCRFLMRGEPPRKNAASWVPTGCRSNGIYTLAKDLSMYTID